MDVIVSVMYLSLVYAISSFVKIGNRSTDELFAKWLFIKDIASAIYQF